MPSGNKRGDECGSGCAPLRQQIQWWNLDYWLIDQRDSDSLGEIEELGITARAIPLLMTDVNAAGAMANSALDLVLGN